jgi:hypothetical protein
MDDKVQNQRVICRGGLNTSENFLMLSEEAPGAATRLVNYETAVTGGYRRINGYRPVDASFEEVTSVGVPAEGPVLGIFGFLNSNTGAFDIIAARKSVGLPVYRYYLYTSGLGWVAMTTGITHNAGGVERIRSETFRVGDDNNIIFVDGVNEATVYDGLNWYELKSTGAGGSGDPGGDQIVDAPSVVAFFKGYIFLGGDPLFPAIIVYSAPTDPLTWTAAAGAGQQIVGYDVVQIKPFRDELYVFGQTAIKKSIPDLASSFVLQDVTNNMGCTARDSVVEVGSNVFFLSADGIRPVAGTDKIGDVELSLMSQSIQTTISQINATYTLTDLNAVVIRTKNQFRYFISDSLAEGDSTYGLLCSARTYNGERKWEFFELVGISANTAWSGYNAQGVEVVYHGDYDGMAYQQEVGNSFNEADITAVYTTPYLDMGDTTIRKLMRKLHMFLRATGSVTLNIGVKYDWDRLDVQNPLGYTETNTSNTVTYDGGAEYDDGSTYGGAAQPVFNTNIQGSGYAVQFSIVTTGTYNPYTIQGLVVEFTPQGRQ